MNTISTEIGKPNISDRIYLTALFLILLFTIPSIYNVVRGVSLGQKGKKFALISEHYEDEDGVATKPALKAYSANIPKYASLICTLIGLILSIISNVHREAESGSVSGQEHWLTFGSWALLLIQAIYVVTLHDPIKSFDYGRLSGVSDVVLCAAIAIVGGLQIRKYDSWQRFELSTILDAVQFLVGLLCILSSFSIPRRPSLVLGDHAVDGQYTVSALSRYTFAWPAEVLKYARKNKSLGLESIPKLHLHMRSMFLESYISGLKKDEDHLLKTLLDAHASTLIFQILFTVGSSIVQFGPQLVMFALLRLLEQREEFGGFTKISWALVLALGFTILIAAWAETWTHWIFGTRLSLPIRSELSAMVFSKAMRRKDVKGVQPHTEQKSVGNVSIAAEMAITVSPVEDQLTSDVEDGIRKSRQSIINLVGVDSKRVSDFAMYLFIFPLTMTKIAVSIVILIQLIGWKSLVSGFAMFIVILPLNFLVSKRFTDAQGTLMDIRDKKLVIITEALQGIRQIKFSAQEQQWQNNIGRARKEELTTQWRVFYLDTCLIALWILGPVMLSAVSLAVYAYLHGSLSAAVAFTSISIFGSLEMALAVIPELISDGLEAFVSLKRINEYLSAPEKDANFASDLTMSFQNASIAWPSDVETNEESRFVLRDINAELPTKKLSVISGATGSGKSLLLAALIGEADQLSGAITRPKPLRSMDRFDDRAIKSNWIISSAIAFVGQIPWIENATIKENILFGLPFDLVRYQKVLSACALEKDLEILPDGDQTDIGANGINLSGGQRWRVSFARALYSRAEVLVLDDIFSAVDAHVGRHLYDEALTGELGQGRTRILVTHHVGLCLPKASYSVVLGNGTVQYAGVPDEEEILKIVNDAQQGSVEKDQDSTKSAFEDADLTSLRKVLSNSSQISKKVDDGEIDTRRKHQPRKFIEEERRETGSVKLKIYREYLNYSKGLWFWAPTVALYILFQGTILGRSWFISIWTSSYETQPSLQFKYQTDPYMLYRIRNNLADESGEDDDLVYYLGTYVGLSVIICILGALRFLLVYRAALHASTKFFENLTFAVLRAPLRWLDTVPVGRILNRMTADFALIDSKLGSDLGFLLNQLIYLVGIIIAGLFVSPWMLLSALLLLGLCAKITSLYLAGAREIKRLDSNAKSPIFEQFSSALAGIGTIRAFGRSEEYIHRMFERIDAQARTTWHLTLFNRWLTWRLNIVGAVFAILIAAVIVYNDIGASLAGFALSFALQYSSALIWSAKQYSDVELSMNAVERVSEYAKIPIEDQSEKQPVPAAWPTQGILEVDDLVAGYAPDLPPVLKGLSFHVEQNQRIGVVGRTGAGKSSLTLALFRFLEARAGAIRIDGIDISTIALSTLRSRLAIIPQDPVLFSGTVRSNLDPFDNHTNAELLDALERVHLIGGSRSSGTGTIVGETEPISPPSNASIAASTLIDSTNIATTTPPTPNRNTFNSLSAPISEGGLNLSQGQRQLLCLARAIVSRPKLMVLDEATSAVDMATDALIQRSIREEFQDATLIVIAHRLSTIADFERVLVMEDGVGVEFDEPGNLMGMEGGVFRGMVEKSGELGKLREIIARSGGGRGGTVAGEWK